MNTKYIKQDTKGLKNATRSSQEYSRILTAAVINMQFRQLLLSNPGKAIDIGFGGEMFNLAREEKKQVAAIRATSLADFASQLNQVIEHAQSVMAMGD